MSRIREPAVILWRARRGASGAAVEVRCTLEQLGEGYFELHLTAGHDLLCVDASGDVNELLARAARLHSELQAAAWTRKEHRERLAAAGLRSGGRE